MIKLTCVCRINVQSVTTYTAIAVTVGFARTVEQTQSTVNFFDEMQKDTIADMQSSMQSYTDEVRDTLQQVGFSSVFENENNSTHDVSISRLLGKDNVISTYPFTCRLRLSCVIWLVFRFWRAIVH